MPADSHPPAPGKEGPTMSDDATKVTPARLRRDAVILLGSSANVQVRWVWCVADVVDTPRP